MALFRKSRVGVLAFALTFTGFAAAQQHVPQWQVAAGGSAKFEIASVKRNNSTDAESHSNIPLTPGDDNRPVGGLFSATNQGLIGLVSFAYKLNTYQYLALEPQLSKWVNVLYDIQARAAGTPTKDQFRLMVQDLLASRFMLRTRYETRVDPIMALLLDKPGKLGPKLRIHTDDSSCIAATSKYLPPSPPTLDGGFPRTCGAFQEWDNAGRVHLGGRKITIQMVADNLIENGNGIDRPVIDETGLTGEYDFVMEFSPVLNGPLLPNQTFQSDPSGPTFQEALKEQLGLKLVPQRGPVEVLVIDHIEEPSPN